MDLVTRSLALGVTSVAALLFFLLLHSWFGPDIWYHLTWGREFVESGRFIPELHTIFRQPIPANGYLLYQAILFLIFKVGGLWGVSLLYVLLWFLITFLWLKLSEMWARPLGPLFALIFVLVCQTRFEHRPEVFSYLFILLMTLLAEKRRFKSMIFLQIIWANMHGYFVFGPLIATMMMYESKKSLKKPLLMGVALLAATGVTPFGFRVWESVWLYFNLGRGLRDLNYELFSPPLWPLYLPTTLFWIAWAATLARSVVGLFRRERLAFVFLSAIGLFLSATALRNIPLLFLLSAGVWRGFHVNFRLKEYVVYPVSLVALLLCYATVSGGYFRYTTSLATFGVHLEWASYPIGAVDFLKKIDFSGRLFTDSYDGGYVEYHLPDVEIAGDSYFSDPVITRKFFAAIKNPEALHETFRQISFDGLLLNIENTDIVNMFLSAPDWVLAYADSHRVVFLPKEKFPQFDGNYQSFTYYHGEDLHHWVYEFGVVTWMALAAMNHSPVLMEKILLDLEPGHAIPGAAFNIALKYAKETGDQNLIRLLAKF